MYQILWQGDADDLIALFTKTMLNDHLPSHYERATQLLFDGVRGVGK